MPDPIRRRPTATLPALTQGTHAARLLCTVLLLAAGTSAAQDRSVYRCPGNLYTDQLSAREAAERGCKTLDGATISVVQTRRPAAAAPGASGAASAPRPAGETRVDPQEQRARDSDARRILEGELRKEEERLGQLQDEQRKASEDRSPRGTERQSELKAAIGRKEADIAAIRRELAKLGGTTP